MSLGWQNFQDDTADLGRRPSSINSILYALLTVNFFAAGAGYLYAPTATLEVTLTLIITLNPTYLYLPLTRNP